MIYSHMSEKYTEAIGDTSEEASFSIDFIGDENILYRVETKIAPLTEENYSNKNIEVIVKSMPIRARDSYEPVWNG